MKSCLVLEGGGMRGVFSAGVMDVLMEDGITFDGLVGVSAGAAFGANYKSEQIGRAIRYNKRFAKDKRYCSFASLIFTGNLFNNRFCYHIVPNKLDIFDGDTFEKNPMDFYIVCTDVETGEPIYKKIEKSGDETFDWIRASSSLPMVSRIVKLDGKRLLDGGIVDSIPIRFAEKMGYEKNLVILTQPKGFVKEPTGSLGLMRRVLKKYPKLIEALENRHNMYNETIQYIEKEEQKGNIIVVRPKEKLIIDRVEHDPDNLEKVYRLGREVAKERLPEIKEYLK